MASASTSPRPPVVSLTVHRAAHQIGGNCIEIATGDGHRLLLDAGSPLDSDEGSGQQLVPPTLDLARPVDGVLLSHPHQDHTGMLKALPGEWPVYGGAACEQLVRLTASLSAQVIAQSFRHWQHRVPLTIGPFTVTPYLTDHSAFDAYMLLIEVHGKRIFYSGDFRLHGRKQALVESLMRNPPGRLDVLLMEGTNLASDKPVQSEAALEQQFCRLFRQTRGRVFVSWSAQNIDRTVTLYRACLQSKRTLVVDLYTAEILALLPAEAAVPRPGWAHLKVVYTRRMANRYRRLGRGPWLETLRQHGMSASLLAHTPERWVVMTRPSLLADLEARQVVPSPDDAWSWSMWRGYLDGEQGRALQQWFDAHGSPACHLHTSGHASSSALRRFAEALKPGCLVPVHGEHWDSEQSSFANVRRLTDGEVWCLD